MLRKIGGFALLFIAAFMFLGFILSDMSLLSGDVLLGILFAVVLPAGAGFLLLKSELRPSRRLQQGRAEVRQRTLQSEVLRLAGERQGRITIVEVVEQLAVPPEEAKSVLDALALEGMADFAVTDAGMVVYDFRELRQLDDKSQAKGILDD